VTVTNVEIEESTKMRQKSFTAAKNCFVVVQASFNYKHVFDFDVVGLPHLITDFFEVGLVNHSDIEFRNHRVRVIGVLIIKFRLIIVYPLVSLVKEIVKPITNRCFCSSKGFRYVVALAVVVMFKGLSLALAWYIEPSWAFVHLCSSLHNLSLFIG